MAGLSTTGPREQEVAIMNRKDVQKWAEQMGMVGLDTETLDRILALALEAEANVARLPKLRKADEPAHVFFVPQRMRE